MKTITRKRETAFQKFLAKNDACASARLFVAKKDGDFPRSWKANRNTHWVQWLSLALSGVKHSEQFPCAACNYASYLDTRQHRRLVLAQARKRGWVKR